MIQHVVIVDDNDLSLRLFSSIAGEIPDVVVHSFHSSAEALEWCRDKDVDCFIIDYNMPAPDGLQMIRLLRAFEAFALVPIVIVTGEHERHMRYQAFDAGATDFVQKPADYRELLARLNTLLALRSAQRRLGMQIGSLEASLLDSEERSRLQAERLEALWRIANKSALQDDEVVTAMLARAAVTIRPGQPFVGLFGRVEGGDLVTDAIGGDLVDAVRQSGLRVGNRVPVEGTFIGEIMRVGGTRSWSDLQTDQTMPEHTLGRGWRAVISANFTAGGSTYALTFASTEPTAKMFGAQDHAYVEILTEFFATRLQQQWQAERIRYQLEHDSMTGLWNRTRFRSLGRAAFRPGEPCALAVIDLVNFHELNEAYGHLTGDAVLVEVAAALSVEAAYGEVVARVGGDSFAVFFPAAPSRASVIARLMCYGAVFGRPISIGDREGKGTVRTAATIGVAFAPADGATLDDLLFRAESRAGSSSASANRLMFPGDSG